MVSHRRRRARNRRGRTAGIVVGAVLVIGVGVLLLVAVRADPLPARLAAGAPPAASPTAPVPAAAVAPAGGPFEGTWVGALDDPDTATVQVRLTVGEPGRGIVLEVPSLRCTYRGADPGRAPAPVAELRADAGGTGCADTARIRLTPAAAAGPATERVRYELLRTCEGTTCTPRRASGVLTAWRPGS